MKNEYLISTKEQLDYFSSIEFDGEGVIKLISKVPDKDKHILIVKRKGNNEISARMLSNIHEVIKSNHDLILLTNESSEYYLNKLYPYVIVLELKLRKLLRLVSALNDAHNIAEMNDNINKLEEITLSKLFVYLFTDINFNNSVKNIFKNEIELKKYNVSKKRFIEIVEGLDENTPWTQLLGNHVPSLIDKYIQVYEVRNKIAHAHNIDYKSFTKFQNLLKNVISELDDTIRSYETTQENIEVNSNEILSKTLANFIEFSKNIEIANITKGLGVLGAAMASYNIKMAPLGNALINLNNNVRDISEPFRMALMAAEDGDSSLLQTLNDFGFNVSELASSEIEEEDSLENEVINSSD